MIHASGYKINSNRFVLPFSQLVVSLEITPLKVIGGFMGLEVRSRKNTMKPAFAHASQGKMPLFSGIFPDMLGQLGNPPALRRIPALRGLGAG